MRALTEAEIDSVLKNEKDICLEEKHLSTEEIVCFLLIIKEDIQQTWTIASYQQYWRQESLTDEQKV